MAMMTGRVLLVCALCVLWCGVSVASGDTGDDAGDLVEDEKTEIKETISNVLQRDSHDKETVKEQLAEPKAAEKQLLAPEGDHTDRQGSSAVQVKADRDGRREAVEATGNVNGSQKNSKDALDTHQTEITEVRTKVEGTPPSPPEGGGGGPTQPKSPEVSRAPVQSPEKLLPPAAHAGEKGLAAPTALSPMTSLQPPLLPKGKGETDGVQPGPEDTSNEPTVKVEPQGHANEGQHHSTQHHEVPQEKELETQEQNTKGQIVNDQHESERLQVQQEKEKQRSEEELERREHLHEEIRDQQKKQEQQEEEHEEPQEEHDDSIKQGKEQEQQQQHQQHENFAKNGEGPTKNETAVGTNATASTGDSDSSTAVSHTTSPLLLLLLVACAAAVVVVAA
ncbi:Mucin-associated surface protein (MASP), subgroup S015 [Trypanosoma cruzi]|nr:Mucin-associated surface protein (MASP), subgroup S015 [Trypanosoma cruzi]